MRVAWAALYYEVAAALLGRKWPTAPLVDAVSTRIVLTTQHEAAGTAVWVLASCPAAVVDAGDEVDAAAD